jgi:hypothetical protein
MALTAPITPKIADDGSGTLAINHGSVPPRATGLVNQLIALLVRDSYTVVGIGGLLIRAYRRMVFGGVGGANAISLMVFRNVPEGSARVMVV